tara:strand:+ start:410 stop:793 length:384 start_codon:yes stop_codon:yes gene_type:complete
MAFKMKGFPMRSPLKDHHGIADIPAHGSQGQASGGTTDIVSDESKNVNPNVLKDKSSWTINPGSGGKPYKGWFWNRAGEAFWGIPNPGETFYTKKDPNVKYTVTTDPTGKATSVYFPPGHGMGGSMK